MSAMVIRSALVLAALSLAGCDSPGFKRQANAPTKPPAVGQTSTTSADATSGAAVPLGPQVPTIFTPGLSVSDAVAKACGIAPRGESTSVNPSFDFDSAAIGDEDRKMLAEVAKCLTEGALKGKAVRLVGRADARGEAEYNMTLGESRASTVHRYLVDLGVGKDHLKPTSRGELDATGRDEAGYAHDRRVDIELAM